MKIINGFCSLSPTYKMFFVSISSSCFLTLYFFIDYVPQIFYGLFFSTITMIMILIYLHKYAGNPTNWKSGEIFLILTTFSTVFHLPFHFIVCSNITYKGPYKDDALIKIDDFLLGWLIKDGQISVWIDNNDFLGPHTYVGMFINNILQICYFFYYIIPFVSLHCVGLLECCKEIVFRAKNNGYKSATYKKHWNNTLFGFSVYLLECNLVFIVNTWVPATSPRTYLKDKFFHPLKLSGFGNYLNKKCKDNRSANSFPSGHVAEILSIGIAYIGMREYLVGTIVTILAILTALATLFLRYHYFCDILMGAFLSLLSFMICYFCGYRHYYKSINKAGSNDLVIVTSPESRKEMLD